MSQAYTTELNAVTFENFDRVVYENIFVSNPTFIKLKSVEELVDGGNDLAEEIALVQNTNAQSYIGLQNLNSGYLTEIVKANLDWAQYNCSISIPNIMILANQGGNQIVNIVSAKMQLAEKAIEDVLGTDLYSANNAIPGISGLQAAVDDSTNVTTYANISRSTYTNWKAQYKANSGTTRALTQTLMNTSYQAARIGNASPKLAAMTQGLWNKLWTIATPQQRIGEPEIAKLGFANMMFNTAMCYVDAKVPTTVSGSTNEMIFFLNLDTFKLKTFKDMNFKFIEFVDTPNQDGVVGHIRVYCALICVMPRLNTQLRDLDSTL